MKFGWNEEVYESARVHAAIFLVGQQWIGGAVVYGQSSNRPNCASAREATNQLLAEVSRQMVETFPGPFFIAGD